MTFEEFKRIGKEEGISDSALRRLWEDAPPAVISGPMREEKLRRTFRVFAKQLRTL